MHTYIKTYRSLYYLFLLRSGDYFSMWNKALNYVYYVSVDNVNTNNSNIHV